MLVVEQNVQSALAVADRVYVIDRGRIVHRGPAAALRDDAARRVELLGRLTHDRAAAARRPARPSATPAALLRPQVTFSLEADFTVDAPGVVGVMGPNGSGKTTLFELITGSNVPTAGRVLVDGQDIHAVRYGERDRARDPLPPVVPGARFRRTPARSD